MIIKQLFRLKAVFLAIVILTSLCSVHAQKPKEILLKSFEAVQKIDSGVYSNTFWYTGQNGDTTSFRYIRFFRSSMSDSIFPVQYHQYGFARDTLVRELIYDSKRLILNELKDSVYHIYSTLSDPEKVDDNLISLELFRPLHKGLGDHYLDETVLDSNDYVAWGGRGTWNGDSCYIIDVVYKANEDQRMVPSEITNKLWIRYDDHLPVRHERHICYIVKCFRTCDLEVNEIIWLNANEKVGNEIFQESSLPNYLKRRD